MANKWIGMGRFTKDPDFRENEVNENSSFCRGTIAVDRPFSRNNDSNQPTADFIPIISFGKTAEFINKHFHKGDPIYVEGRIQTGKYTNRDGQTVYTTDVLVEKAEFTPRNEKTGNGGGSNNGQRDASEKRRDDFRDIPDGVNEELPFN